MHNHVGKIINVFSKTDKDLIEYNKTAIGLNPLETKIENIDRYQIINVDLSIKNIKQSDYIYKIELNYKFEDTIYKYLKENNIDAKIRTVSGSVEIAPAVGMGDAIFDIVSSGGTLLTNGLKEVQTVIRSEAVLIASKDLPKEKAAILQQLVFRFESIKGSRGKRYLLMNIPNDRIAQAIKIVPAMRSPTVLPLAQEGWSSLHSVVDADVLWEKIEQLKCIGAEGILVLAVEKMVL